MAAKIKEGMTGGQVADIIEQNFENLEDKFQLLSDLFDHTKEDLQRTLDEYQELVDDAYGSLVTKTDEEDTTTDLGKIKFKDRAYEPDKFSGKGYKILRKNIVCNTETGESKNILTQDMIDEPNTVYEIRYDFDLNGETINIPEGCTLKFEGGFILNGYLKGYLAHIYIYVDNFIGKNDDEKINNAISFATNLYIKNNIFSIIIFSKSEYNIYKTIYLPIFIRLRSNTFTVNINDYTEQGAIEIIDNDIINKYDTDFSIIPIIENFSFTNKTDKQENTNGKHAIKINYCNVTIANVIYKNISISNYNIAFNITSNNFWRNRFNNINIQNCYIGFYFNGTTKNSGENILINDSLISNNNCAIYIGSNSLKIRVTNSSIDYNGICVYSPDNDNLITNFNIEFNKCWIEGNGSRTTGINNNKGIAHLNTTVTTILNYNISILRFVECEIVEMNYYIYPQIKADVNAILDLIDNTFYLQNSVTEENANLNASNFYWYFTKGFKVINFKNNTQKVNTTLKLSELFNIIPENDLENINAGEDVKETNFFNIINKHNINSIKIVELTEFNNNIKCIEVKSSVINDGQQAIVDFESKNFYNFIGNEFASNVLMKNRTNDNDNPINYYTVYIDFYDNNYIFIKSCDIATNFSVDNINFHGSTNNFLQNISIPINVKYYKVRVRLIACSNVFTKNTYTSYLYNFSFLDYSYNRKHEYNNNIVLIGNTKSRPIINNKINSPICYFDTNINKPVWWNNTEWVDSEGNNADSTSITSGTFTNKPTGTINLGYAYFCTDRLTTEGSTNGIMIYYKGSNTWVDALGRVVS